MLARFWNSNDTCEACGTKRAIGAPGRCPGPPATGSSAGCIGNKIITRSGKMFDFANPQPEQICIEDVAFALSNICRYTGHCQFYSVAEHSLHCSYVAEDLFPGLRDLMFAALMHDAAEAYTGDVSKPLKNMLPDFMAIEKQVEAVVNAKFSVPTIFESAVKGIDLGLFKAERDRLFLDDIEVEGINWISDFQVDIKCWEPAVAEEQFMKRFRLLTGE
jgi:hypothetical protein